MYVWGAIALITVALVYLAIRIKESNDLIEQASQDVHGLAGDIVSLGFVIQMLARSKDEQDEQQEGAA